MSQQKKKAEVLARELAQRLTLRFGEAPTRVVTQSVDASGNQVITIDDGTPAAGEQNVYIRILEQAPLTAAVNAVGIAQPSYGPHVIQVVMESSSASVGAAGAGLLLDVHAVRLSGEIFRTGARVEWYLRANLGAPVGTDIVAANLAYAFRDLWSSGLADM